MTFDLKNHPIGQEFAEILDKIDPNALAIQHLEDCNYKVMGYYDEEDYYEEVEFMTPIEAKLVSSTFGLKNQETNAGCWITLNFLLKAVTSLYKQQSPDNDTEDKTEEIDELKLVFDSNMNFIDENWVIYIESPFVVAKKENLT